MNILSRVTTGRKGRAQKVVIFAPEGFGKSTLASRFPNPLFLDVEDSTSQLDVRRLSRSDIPDLKAFESALKEITPDVCATLIVDTMDWLEQMALDAVIADEGSPKIKGIEDFGYGKGFIILRERVTILLAKFDTVIARGVTVVLLAHSKVSKFEPPDGAGPYDRYELKLSKQVAPLIKEWADMLLFGNWRTQVRERDKGESGAAYKGVGGKDRLLHCNRSAAWDAKNRHGLADVEKWDIAVIEKAFRDVGAPWGDEGAAPSVLVVPEPVISGGAMKGVAKLADAHDEGAATAGAGLPEKAATAGSNPAPLLTPAAEDQIPGLPVASTTAPEVDAELERICTPHAHAITAYLVENRRIEIGQTWRDMSPEFAKRVKKNPAGFLKVAVRGEAVAA